MAQFRKRNNPENRDFAKHIKMDEKNAMDRVMKEIGRYGSLKISFDKEIHFQKEREERGPNGERQFEKMTHFFKGEPFIATKATARSEIVEKYRKAMDDIKSEIDAWDAEGSGWTVDSVESSYVNTAPWPAELHCRRSWRPKRRL